jgi:hypothetical protein
MGCKSFYRTFRLKNEEMGREEDIMCREGRYLLRSNLAQGDPAFLFEPFPEFSRYYFFITMVRMVPSPIPASIGRN